MSEALNCGAATNDAPCPKCKGTKRYFVQTDADHRTEFECPECGGTGRVSDAVYRSLTGEAEHERLKFKDTHQHLGWWEYPQ